MDGGTAIKVETTTLADGVYFGLDEDVYHAQPRLSASGIKNLLVSGMDFWARSWLNPRRKEDDDDADWKVYGRAYHKRILEGREAFYAAYASEIDPADHPGCLTKQAQFKEECRRLCLPVGGTNDELVARLQAAGCDKPLLPALIAENARTNAGKIFLKADWFHTIELSAACIFHNPTLSKVFSGGFPEVSVLWTAEVQDGRTGEIVTVPMKMRADYLKTSVIADLKTFANKMQKPIDRAVFHDIASNRYHIQVANYYAGIEAAEAMVERGQVHVVSGQPPKHKWLDAFAKEPKTFVFVYQQKGIAPIAGGYTMDDAQLSQLLGAGRAQIRDAQLKFAEYLAVFGDDPWIVDYGMKVVDDTDIPGFAVQ